MEMRNHLQGRGFRLQTLVVAALATAVSIFAYIYTRPSTLMFDENYYVPLARSIAGGSYQDGYIIRPPLYPLFLAAIFRLFGTGFGAVLLIESILRGGLVAGVSFLGRKYVSTFAGLAGALLLAVYPLLIWTYTRFISEVLYIPLFLVSFFLLEKAVRSERSSDTAVAGVFSGLATLARSTSLVFTLIVAAWLVMRKSQSGRFSRRNFANACVLIVMLLVTISPWTIRNAVVHKAFIPVDNAAAFNLYLITSGKKIQEVTAEWESWGGQAERQREGLKRWRDYLKADPAFHIRRMGTVLPKLFDPSLQASASSLSAVRTGAGSRRSIVFERLLAILAPVTFWLITAGGIIGIVRFEHNVQRRTLLLITIIYFVLLHGMTLARPRFLLPVNALLAIYAGALIGWARSRLGWTRRSLPSR
jgi:4-amino-4-deoxy-L-arabinose transferase-like glycosyltransferase